MRLCGHFLCSKPSLCCVHAPPFCVIGTTIIHAHAFLHFDMAWRCIDKVIGHNHFPKLLHMFFCVGYPWAVNTVLPLSLPCAVGLDHCHAVMGEESQRPLLPSARSLFCYCQQIPAHDSGSTFLSLKAWHCGSSIASSVEVQSWCHGILIFLQQVLLRKYPNYVEWKEPMRSWVSNRISKALFRPDTSRSEWHVHDWEALRVWHTQDSIQSLRPHSEVDLTTCSHFLSMWMVICPGPHSEGEWTSITECGNTSEHLSSNWLFSLASECTRIEWEVTEREKLLEPVV